VKVGHWAGVRWKFFKDTSQTGTSTISEPPMRCYNYFTHTQRKCKMFDAGTSEPYLFNGHLINWHNLNDEKELNLRKEKE